MAGQGDAHGVHDIEQAAEQGSQVAPVGIAARGNVAAGADQEDVLPDAVILIGSADHLLELEVQGPLLGGHVAARLILQGLVIRSELSLRVLEGTVAFQIGGHVPDGDGNGIVGEIRKRVREGSGRHLQAPEGRQEAGPLLRAGGRPFQDDVFFIGFREVEGGPVRGGADEVRIPADAGGGPDLEDLRRLTGGQESHGGTADATGQIRQAGRFQDAHPGIQGAAGGVQQGFRGRCQQQSVLVRGLETGPGGHGLEGSEGSGIGQGHFRGHKRDERAAVVQRDCHPRGAGLGQIGHQGRALRSDERLQDSRGVRDGALRLRRTVEAEHRGGVGRNGPQQRILRIVGLLPGFFVPVQPAHGPRDSRQHQRDRDDRYESPFLIHFYV